jgi:hypothetical protein
MAVDKIIGGIIRELYNINKDDIKESIISELESLTESKALDKNTVENLIPSEGIADKYAERQFNIPDSSAEQDYQATKAMQANNTMGEYVGDVKEENNNGAQKVRVFANPRNLEGFQKQARAISDINGNMFVAERDGRFSHDELKRVIMKSKYGNSGTGYMEWYRQGSSNIFGWSVTYTTNNQFDKKTEAKYLDVLKRKNSQFRYLVPQKPKQPNQVNQPNQASNLAEEGVADKYAERQFNIPDPNVQQDIQAKGEIQKDVEKPYAKVDNTPIYKNPRSLENFGANVRAIADYKGDLYVAQEDSSFNHGKMGNVLFPGEGVWQFGFGGVYENLNKYALLQRIADSNDFGLSDISNDYVQKDEDQRESGEKILLKTKQKNPQYNFHNEYYDDVYDKSDSSPVGTASGLQKEGVADKYGEKQFNIPDQSKEQDRQATQAMGQQEKPDDPKGLLVGNTDGRPATSYSKARNGTNIFLNPRSLDSFEDDVKAVSNTIGDLFVAQADADIYHADITNVAEGQDIYNEFIGNAYDGEDCITWHRIGRSNDFGFSVSYMDFNKEPENHPTRDKLIKAVKSKNPQFNYIPQYWHEVLNIRYDQEHNMNNSDLQNYNDAPNNNNNDNDIYDTRPKNYPIYSNMKEQSVNENNENGTIDNSNETGKIDNGNETGKIAEANVEPTEAGDEKKDIVNNNDDNILCKDVVMDEQTINNDNNNELVFEGWGENLQEGIDVWHGSTEKFDRFDMNRVGTGDGKSLGGWGIYFSENPEVSKRYYLPKGQLKQHEIRSGNYFDLDLPLENGQRILQGLNRQGIDQKDLDEFQETYVDNYDTNGKQAYDWLSFVLGGEQQASKFLESLGYIGNTMLDRWEPDSRNYVVFDSKSIIQ